MKSNNLSDKPGTSVQTPKELDSEVSSPDVDGADSQQVFFLPLTKGACNELLAEAWDRGYADGISDADSDWDTISDNPYTQPQDKTMETVPKKEQK